MNVMIGSPGGMASTRKAVEDCILEWNILNSDDSDVILLPIRWESHATSILGTGTGQDSINARLLDQSHILIAIMHEHFGTPTGKFNSGTEEEVERAIQLGLRVHLFFSNEPAKISAIDTTQLDQVRAYRQKMRSRGLYREYANKQELSKLIRLALVEDVKTVLGGPRSKAIASGISPLRASLDISPNEPNKLILLNTSDHDLRGVSVDKVQDDNGPRTLLNQGAEVTIRSGQRFTYTLVGGSRFTGTVKFEVSWHGPHGESESLQLQL